MTTYTLARTDLDALSETDAERLLRRVLKATNLKLGGEPAVSAETRQSLLESLQHIDAPIASVLEPGPDALDQLTRQALRVLAEDPVFGELGSDAPSSRDTRTQPPRDFSVGPIEFVGAVSLALLVLNTYVDLKRDADGRWTFHLRIKATSDKLKAQVMELAKRLIPVLPHK